MTMLDIIVTLFSIAGLVAGVIYWHINSLKKIEEKFESKLEVLSEKHQKLQDDLKDLKHRDDLQQMAIDSIGTLWPLINDRVKKMKK